MLEDVPHIFEAVFQCTLEVTDFMDCVFDGLKKLTWRFYLCFVYTLLTLFIHPIADDN